MGGQTLAVFGILITLKSIHGQTECITDSLRLVEGGSRVELCTEGVWNTFCERPTPVAEVKENVPPLLLNDPSTGSNRGTLFALGFFGNAQGPFNLPNASLYFSTSNSGGARINVSFLNFVQTLEITQGATKFIQLPTNTNLDIRVNSNLPEEQQKAIVIDSDQEISVIGVNDNLATTDAFLALPCKSFRSVDQSSNLLEYQYFVFSASAQNSLMSSLLIVPCENSEVAIVFPDGRRDTHNLRQYQTFLIQNNDDLTGTVVTSNSPLSVFVGHECGQVPRETRACDHLVEQIPPQAVYGTMFFALPFAQRESGDLFRIGSVTDNNEVTITCTRRFANGSESVITESATINSGQFYSYRTLSKVEAGSTSSDYRRDFCCIETSKPATVMQYALGHGADGVFAPGIAGFVGDPAMTLVPPVNQYSNNYIINTLDNVLILETGERQEFNSFISWAIAAPLFNPNVDLMINDNPYPPPSRALLGSGEYVPIRCSNGEICGYGAFGPLQPGDSVVSYNSSGESGAAVYISVYGFMREVSYAYPAGFQCEPIGLPNIGIFDITVSEEAGSVTIPFNRTGGDLSYSSRIAVRTVEVAGGGTQSNLDFTPVPEGRVRWVSDAVDPTSPFVIDITNDDMVEPTEYFEVHFRVLSTGFAFPDTFARVTILDNDTAKIGFFEDEIAECENSTVVQFMVGVISGSLQEIVTVNFSTVAGTAEADVGYNSTSLLLSFTGNQSHIVNVSLIDDEEFEGNRTFFGVLQLVSDQPNVFLTNSTATVFIIENEEEPVSTTELTSSSINQETASSSFNIEIVYTIAAVLAVIILMAAIIIIMIAILCVRSRRAAARNIPQKEEHDYYKSGEGHELADMMVKSSYRTNLPPSLIINSCNLQLNDPVGQGEFGIVYKARLSKGINKAFGEVVAVKTLKGFLEKSLVDGLLQECTKMSSLDHPNVLALTGVCLDGGPAPYIIMPFMFNGSLLSHLKKHRESLVLPPEQEMDSDNIASVTAKLMDMSLQVAKGMEYLASKRLVHRDLAARNCMIDMNMVIKVADFGLSESVSQYKDYFRQNKDEGVKLPVKWLAPECLNDGVFSEKSDVWAYGVTNWEIFNGGKAPYPGINPMDLPRLLESGYRMDMPSNLACNEAMSRLISQCWAAKAEERPTFCGIATSLSHNLESFSGYMDFSKEDDLD